ncbi:MAG TPA: translation initiation factor IF-3 [Bacteroidales bacterium]|nr:translation initiation factor IF-3 [Bacteroidales bacterium]HRZ49038.1 translation initiation factor IF-3 [Bacteroidales bacterium]
MALQDSQFPGRRRFGPVKKEDPHRINHRITAPVVRVVGENVETAILPLRDAIRVAEELELDLVEISPTANPPVCRVMDYKKFLYEQKKKQKEMKAKSAKVVIKEIRLGPNTDDHDFDFKLKHAQKFLEEGAKVKVDVFFKGRSIIYKEKGEIILLKFAQELESYGKLEQMPRLEGKRMIIIIAPK